MESFISLIFSTTFAFSILRITTPILFAAMGALISDRAGVINIGLEGTMLISALAGVIMSAYSGSAWLGLIAAVLAGALATMLMAYFALELNTDVVLAGIALNLMAGGGTTFVLYMVAKDKGISTSLHSMVLPQIEIPLIKEIPILGAILSGHNVLTYLSLLSVVFVGVFLFKTPLGLKIRAVGENADAVASVGISVKKIKYISLIMSGALASMGGAFMSMGYVSWFSTNMTSGRGFIALAAEAMGGATPLGTLYVSLLFGAVDALSNSIQLKIPVEVIQSMPYAATILGLVIYNVKRLNKNIKKKKLPANLN
jgi:simple sugar transport system permease protein